MSAPDVEPTTPTPWEPLVSRPSPRTTLITAFGGVLVVALAAVAAWWLLADDDAPSPDPVAAVVTTTQSPGDDRTEGTDVDLPTHDWQPGDDADDGLITGTLSTDRSNCVVLGNADGKTTYPAWPAGYSAVIGADGVVRLRDAEGRVVAESGDAVEMGGGYGRPASREHACVPDKGDVALVQSAVTVTEPREHLFPRDAEPSGAPDDAAYRAWRDRTPYASCGEQFLSPFLDGAALAYADCLRDAVAESRAAEAVVTFTTVEGDPITSYLRVRPNGTVEVFTDSTQDKFGSGTWERRTCRRLEAALQLSC